MIAARLTFAAALLACSAAAAQDFQPFPNAGTIAMQREMLKQGLRAGGHSTGPAPARPAGGARPAGPGMVPLRVSTGYRTNPQVSQRVRQQFVQFIRRTSGPQAAAAIGAEMNRRDYLRVWAAHAAEDGLRPGDVADVMASYWVQNWQMANGVDYAQPQSVRAVRRQVAGIMSSTPSFARLSEAQRQEMAEAMIYNQILQGENYLTARKRGDGATARRLGDAAVARFRNEMGVDLRRLALTPNGFVER